MMRPVQTSRSMPIGWAKRRTTSKGRLNPLAATLAIVSSSSSFLPFSSECFRALEGPEEQRGQSGVFFERARQAVARLRFRRAKHLLKGRPTNDLPDLFQVLGKADLAALSGLHRAVAAEDFQARVRCRRTLDPRRGCLRPASAPSSPRRGAEVPVQDIGPVADRGVLKPWAADEVDAGSEGR